MTETTLRERAAIAAMQALIREQKGIGINAENYLVKKAVEYADALIKELEEDK